MKLTMEKFVQKNKNTFFLFTSHGRPLRPIISYGPLIFAVAAAVVERVGVDGGGGTRSGVTGAAATPTTRGCWQLGQQWGDSWSPSCYAPQDDGKAKIIKMNNGYTL